MSRFTILIALAVATLPLHMPAVAARIQAQPTSNKLDTWLFAVQHHTPGERDLAVAVIAPWSRSELDRVLSDLKDLLNVHSSSPRLGFLAADVLSVNRLLKRAALLHTDIAVLHRTETGYDLPPDGRSGALVGDGLQVGTQGGTFHWAIARQLLDAVRPSPAKDDGVRRWYQATAAFLQSWNEYSEFEPHLRRAHELLTDDAVLRLYSGTMHEAYAEPRIQNAFALTKVPARAILPVAMAAREYREAERLFRQAIEINPDLTEARIRLAHVLGIRGRHDEAVQELKRALEQPLPPLLRYYALLFLGREEQILGLRDLARNAFEQAVTLFPGAQSPWLGLSQLARDRGDRLAALRALDLLRLPPNTPARGDPWHIYDRMHVPGADELVADLRASLRQ
jgi:hypothetical protein